MHKGLGKRLNINTTDHSMHPEIDHMIHVISVENMAIGQINATRREEVDIPLVLTITKRVTRRVMMMKTYSVGLRN